jgi:hypothetical protein
MLTLQNAVDTARDHGPLVEIERISGAMIRIPQQWGDFRAAAYCGACR